MRTPTILFDLDGTLIETAPDLADTLNTVIAKRGHDPMPEADVRPFIGHGAREMIRRALDARGDREGLSDLDSLLADFLVHYERRIARLSHPFPGLLDAMDRLAAGGARFAVATNKRERLARLLLDELGMAERFAAIAGPDTYGAGKPDPVFLGGLMADLGARPEATVMVGDSRTDRDAARAVGIPVVGVTFGYTDTPMADLAPDALIDHFDQLPAAVDRVLARAA